MDFSAKDLSFVSDILRGQYLLSTGNNGIRCKSTAGIAFETVWEDIVLGVKKYFGERFSEIYHNTNHHHRDFVIYLK